MKKINKIAIVLFAGLLLMSCENQKKVSEIIYGKYNGENGFSILVLPPNFASKFVDKKDTDQKELLSTIKDFRIMIFDNKIEGKTSKTVLDDINKLLDKRNFEEYMTINKDGSKVTIKAIEKNGVVREMHVLIGGEEKLIMASLTGKIDMAKVTKTMNEMNFGDYRGLGALQGLSGNLNFDDFKIKL